METNNTKRIHPLVAAAAVSVMLVSLVGVAAITGVLPNSHSTIAPTAALSTPAPAASVPAASADTKVAEKEAAPVAPAHPVVKHKPVKHAANTVPTTAPTSPNYAQQMPPVAQAPAICYNCGRVESVQAVQQKAKPSGVGMIAGGVVGGLLGNQVGGGNGKTLATVAGAVGGGFAGNEIEKRTRGTTTYEVHVRMEDGTLRTFPQTSQGGWQVGDRVKVVNGALASQG